MQRTSFALLAVALAAAPLAVAGAQSSNYSSSGRYTGELYLSQQWIASDATSGHEGAGGVGARLMFGHASPTRTLDTFFQRARAGLFVTYFAKQGSDDLSAYHLGAQADFPLFAAPVVGGHLDPFVSLAAGYFHTSVTGRETGTNVTSNDFALTPAAGTLIPLVGSVNLRGDLRDVIVFGQGNTSNNFVLEGGVSVGF